jgi:YidC/Oxa1 family membrane protein insertase
MQDNKNLFLAIALSLAVLVGWNAFFGLPNPEEHRKQIEAAKQPASGAQAPSGAAPTAPVILPIAEALKASARIQIETPKIIGSFPLTGGEIDDISFRGYHETVDPQKPDDPRFVALRQQRSLFCRIRLGCSRWSRHHRALPQNRLDRLPPEADPGPACNVELEQRGGSAVQAQADGG